MHELSLCGAIADIVTRHAGERQVEAVHVRIGELRQVVPDTLTFCWSMVTSGTELDGSSLDVERVRALLRCRNCQSEHEMGEYVAFACASCGAIDVEVVSGEEFLVTALDLAEV